MLNENISNIDEKENQKEHFIKFTKRESECMTQVMQNKSLAQIAENLDISERTVHFYLTGVRNKLDLLL